MMQQQQQQQQQIIITPTANDVLCGRGKSYNNHSGNIQFISIVKDHVQTYMNLSSRFEKTLLVRNLVHKLTNEIGTRFLRKSSSTTTTSSTTSSTSTSTSSWYPLNEEETYTKVGHAIRDMIKLNRKKSNASNNNNNKSSQAIKKMKQQTTPTNTTAATTAPVICFEPIQCHSTENLIDHCITTRALSLKTSDLLTSILNVVQTTTTEEEEDQDDFEMIMMAAEAATPPPPQLARFVSDESSSCNVFPPPTLSSSSSSSDRRSPSFCVVKAFGLDLIDSDEDACYSNLIMNDDDDTFFQF
jgi:hypothetical protein